MLESPRSGSNRRLESKFVDRSLRCSSFGALDVYSYLRGRARTTLQLGLDGVVPPGQSFVGLQSKRSNLIRCGFETPRILSAVEISRDLKSSLGLSAARIVEDLLVGIQRFACPVS